MIAPERSRHLDAISSFIELTADGSVTVFSGKVELGTGIATALAQIVAGELGIAVSQVHLEMGDTGRTPNEGTTAGSKTLQIAGPRLRRAAVAARRELLREAGERLEVAVSDLVLSEGTIRSRDGAVAIGLGDLAGVSLDLPVPADLDDAESTNPLMGVSIPRVDVRAKLTGEPAYIHDLRLPEMLHGRVIRLYRRTLAGAGTLRHVDDTVARNMPGVVRVVRNGDFLGVVAEQEWQAIRAAEAVRVEWAEAEPLPAESAQFAVMRRSATHDTEPVRTGDVDAALASAARTVTATYTFPVQAHASTGPSCAVADVRGDRATVFCSSQGVEALRLALAPVLGLPAETVRVVFREGAGCYGHNGADDVAADAALLSQAVGRPVRVQWMRRDEFAWEPKSPAMLTDMAAAIGEDGTITGWQHTTWTATHTSRPGGQPGHLLAANQVDPPFPAPAPRHGGGDRNAATTYAFPAERVTMQWVTHPPLHTSAMRSLGGLHNTTANECFLDEIAFALGHDPVDLRRRYLDDPRALAVVEAAAQRSGWGTVPIAPAGWLAGQGFAYARYEGEYAYVALVAEVLVDPATGEVRVARVVVAHDCGLVINPDGVRNQVEGNVIQGIGRSLHEAVHWDDAAVTTLTWETYRVVTFPEVPEIDIVLIDRPDQPPWGAGEPAICPVTAAIGNAIFAATGARLRDVPFTPERVRAALVG